MHRTRKHRSTRAALAAALLLAAPAALALPGFYAAECQSCHGAATATNPTTCNGCHAHGVHSSPAGGDISLAATLPKSSFAPGETVTVTLVGGNRTGWARAVLFDAAGNELARVSCPSGLGGCTTSVFPFTLAAPAPAAAGSYTWLAAWYGNESDAGGSFGQGSSATIRAGFYTPDPGNPTHGWQTIAVPTFTVAQATAPAIALQPTSLTFPTVTVGASGQQTTQVRNTGTAPLTVSGISRCAGTSGEFSWSPAPAFTVPPGGSTTLTVTYAPTAAGTDSGCLSIASNDAANPAVSLGLSASAVAPSAPGIALSPSSLSFGDVVAGSAATRTTQVQNTGSATLTVSAIGLCSGTSAEFSWAPAAPFDVATGQAATLTVTYAPTAAGADAGCLALTSNAGATPAQLSVSGAGVAAPVQGLALDPGALDFGQVQVGGQATRSTQIRNTGTAASTVTAVAPCGGTSPEFAWSPAPPITVSAGQSATLTVAYAPTAAGADDGCLLLTTDVPGTPTLELGLAAAGVAVGAPAIALAPAALDFGTVSAGGQAMRTAQIQNGGSAPLHVAGIAACAGTSPEFTWTPQAPLTVAAGRSTGLQVTYAPTGDGADTGCLTIASDDPLSPTVQLQLAGAGSSGPTAGVDLDVDELEVPRRFDPSRRPQGFEPELELRNRTRGSGGASATLVGVLSGAEVYRQTVAVTAGASREVEVTFPAYAPAAGTTGAVQWTVTVADQDPDTDQATARTVLGPRRSDKGDDEEDEGEEDDDHGGGSGAGDVSASLGAGTPGASAGCESLGDSGGPLALVGLALAWWRRRALRLA